MSFDVKWIIWHQKYNQSQIGWSWCLKKHGDLSNIGGWSDLKLKFLWIRNRRKLHWYIFWTHKMMQEKSENWKVWFDACHVKRDTQLHRLLKFFLTPKQNIYIFTKYIRKWRIDLTTSWYPYLLDSFRPFKGYTNLAF